jgi:hypothetical protein
MEDLMTILNMPNVVSARSYGNNNTNYKTIRFSGCRDYDVMQYLRNLGHDCTEGAVTKNTNILLIPYSGFSSTKVTQANKYNSNGCSILIVPINEFRMNPDMYL